MSVTLHVWVSIHHMIVFFVAQVQNDDTSRYFFHFFKIVVFWVVRRVGVKRQKIAQNDKKIPSNSVSQKLYFIWLWLLVHMCKMVMSAAIFFFFFFFFFFFIFFFFFCFFFFFFFFFFFWITTLDFIWIALVKKMQCAIEYNLFVEMFILGILLLTCTSCTSFSLK